ncbi:malonyl-ACP O-methyltransferase BioC [Pelagibaculum spongiae]|uniref:Malonyl-[acyl-carrier protein] O-methyltransferase n=1 Tax=Pelagibaculum spongiae TaxID=2080658 RepID=A0A2V1GV17_9GAMM|nr:malonyl-ACP O-methyltransferase BioC [Pelagibaculum spongiae]PVZ63555.1 malonyl-[acyl-carrier protein] O-methyltransferase BioC [Pelagibaculum spongiae]
MTESNLAIDRSTLAASFSKAANDYDALAQIQFKTGCELLAWANQHSQFATTSQQAKLLLDLGCGTAQLNRQLQQQWPQAHILGLDLAQGMLQQAKRGHLAVSNSWLCADAELLPLADQSIDAIYSNFALQWCELDKVMVEAKRVLKPQGQLLFTTLLEGTLAELQFAWQQADSKLAATVGKSVSASASVHVNRFLNQQQALDTIEQHFPEIQFQTVTYTEFFPDVFSLMRSIKGIGARNLNSGRANGLTGKQRLAAMQQAYETLRTEQGLPLSWQVLMITRT